MHRNGQLAVLRVEYRVSALVVCSISVVICSRVAGPDSPRPRPMQSCVPWLAFRVAGRWRRPISIFIEIQRLLSRPQVGGYTSSCAYGDKCPRISESVNVPLPRNGVLSKMFFRSVFESSEPVNMFCGSQKKKPQRKTPSCRHALHAPFAVYIRAQETRNNQAGFVPEQRVVSPHPKLLKICGFSVWEKILGRRHDLVLNCFYFYFF